MDDDAAAYVSSLSETEIAELRTLDRATLGDRLKAAGLKKMGLRMKVQSLLSEGGANTARPDSGTSVQAAGKAHMAAVADISDPPLLPTTAVTPPTANSEVSTASLGSIGPTMAATNLDDEEATTTCSTRSLSCRADYDALLRDAGAHLAVVSFVCSPAVLLRPEIFKEMRRACNKTWPAFDQLEASGKFPFVFFARLDVDDDVKTAQECGINIIPSFHLYRYGKKIADYSGHDIDGLGLRALLLEHGGPPVTVAHKAAVRLVDPIESRPELAGQRGSVLGYGPSTGNPVPCTQGTPGQAAHSQGCCGPATSAAINTCAPQKYQVEVGEAKWPGQKLEVLEVDRSQIVLTAYVALRAVEGEALPSACAGAGAAIICGYDPQACEYELQLEEGGSVTTRLPPSCVVLPRMTAGLIVGLKGAPQHNGKAGLLVEIDEAADRYVVALDRQTTLRLKRANFRA